MESWKNPSFVLEKVNEVKYQDRNIPELKSAHDVIVQVKFTGICGSDVHYLTHGEIGPFKVTSPMVLGHESSGIIYKVGDQVSTLEVGDPVAMEPGIPCRRCERCKEGFYNLCVRMQFAATPPYDGTLCRYYVLPEDFCVKLPEDMSLEEGALVEPTAVAVHVCKQANVIPGSTVVVFGAGPVGLLCCAVSRAYGATKIVSVDINKERLAFAEKYAASATFVSSSKESPEENAKRCIEECGLGLGADSVIDATGAEVCIQTGVHVTRSGGTYCQAGNGKSDISFPLMAMSAKEMTVKGSFRYSSGDYKLAVNFISSGRLKVKELISRKVRFAEAEQAFEDVKAGKGIKVLIEGPEGGD